MLTPPAAAVRRLIIAARHKFTLAPQPEGADRNALPLASSIHLLLQALQAPIVRASVPLQSALVVFLHSLLMRTTQHRLQTLGAAYRSQVRLSKGFFPLLVLTASVYWHVDLTHVIMNDTRDAAGCPLRLQKEAERLAGDVSSLVFFSRTSHGRCVFATGSE